MAKQKLHKLQPEEGMTKEKARKLNERQRQTERRNRRKLKQAGIIL